MATMDDDELPPPQPREAPPSTAPRPPIWTHFLTPIAVLAGAFVVAGAIWLSDGGGGGGSGTAVAPDLDSVSTAPSDDAVTPTTVLDALMSYARQVEIDTDEFRVCLGEENGADVVNAHLAVGNEFGVSGTPTFFINNKRLVGAQPTEIFMEIIEAELDGSPDSLDGYSEAVLELARTSPPRFEIVDEAPPLAGATFEGNEDAAVTVAEFSDFQCPFCQRWSLQTLPSLRAELGDDVRIAFMHFPITAIHPNAGFASVAAICAGEQEKFWEMHDLLFARQGEWAGLPVQ